MTRLGNSFPGNESFPETTEKEGAIPADIIAAAKACYEECEYSDSGEIVETIARAILTERERIAARLEEEADLTPCSEDAMVTRSNARLIRADFDYAVAEQISEMEDADR